MKSNSPAALLAISEVRYWCKTGHAAQLRKAADLSQSEVARTIGTYQPVVSYWERGERLPTGKYALRYYELLTALAHSNSTREAS